MIKVYYCSYCKHRNSSYCVICEQHILAAPPTQYEPEKWYTEGVEKDGKDDFKPVLEKIK